jgi:hypothetical protein
MAFLVDHLADRNVFAALLGDLRRAPRSSGGQRIAQRGVGRDEGGARQVQAHHLHQHLVAVGGAVESTGAGAVIGLRLAFQQLFAGGLALRIALADRRLLFVRQAGSHGAGRHEHRRQVAEVQRADQQARNDLVAYAEIQGRVEHIVRQRHRGAHGDRVAREQRQLHARLALGHAVAHGGHAARELRHRAGFAHGVLDNLREGFERLVRRQHVVIRGYDSHRRLAHLLQHQLVVRRESGEAVGQVGAGQGTALRALHAGCLQMRQVGAARWTAALDDPLGDYF